MSSESFFSRSEILMGRDKAFPITPEMSDNLDKLIAALNPIRAAWNKPLVISSGYRPSSINSSVGGAKASAHMMCQAVDIVDKDGKLAEWILNNLDFVKESGILGIENPTYTKGWVHLSTRPAKSGKLVFIP